jgi:hypothetical protein
MEGRVLNRTWRNVLRSLLHGNEVMYTAEAEAKATELFDIVRDDFRVPLCVNVTHINRQSPYVKLLEKDTDNVFGLKVHRDLVQPGFIYILIPITCFYPVNIDDTDTESA